ncbi:MAG: Gfo/Idh/MocA family oxidoreductase [Oscillospiraceae bacterium]|nr:Gfo/Idh/MocA family oxidoreductase [Oscillospiraceae bacterium]
MINIGLIGCGKISAGQIAAIDTIENAKIVAACDLSEENLKAVTEKTGARAYTDYKELLTKEKIDLVIISLPHFLHGEATCFAAEKGIDVFLEKPMGISVADCKNMIEVCRENNVMLWVGHAHCFNPAYMRAKELIDSGKLGSPISFSETRNMDYFAASRPRWFLKKELSGGGIMINLGAHCLDKMKFFSGSEIADIHGQVHIREGYDVEDSVQAFVRMKNGFVGTITLVGNTAAYSNPTTVYLTKGEIRISAGGMVEYCGCDGVFKSEQCETSGMKLQLKTVVEKLEAGDKTPVISGDYGLDIIRAITKLYEKSI